MPDPAKMREGRSGRATRDTVTAGPCEGRQDRGGAEGKCAWGGGGRGGGAGGGVGVLARPGGRARTSLFSSSKLACRPNSLRVFVYVK